MTVSSDQSRGSYVANSGPYVFVVPFYFLETSHVRVVQRTTTGVETTLTEGIDYDVTGAGDSSGGSVTFKAGQEPASGDGIVIIRNLPITQETDYVENDAFTAETHERALDKLTMINQQQTEELNRAIKLPIGYGGDAVTLKDPVAYRFLRFSADGAAIEPVEVTSSVSEFAPVLSSPVAEHSLLKYEGGNWSDAAGSELLSDIGAEPADADILKADETDNLTAGFTTDLEVLGESGTATTVIDLTKEHLKTLTVTGSFTLAAPASGSGACDVLVTTNATGGYTIDTSDYDYIVGNYDNSANSVHLFSHRSFGDIHLLLITGLVT
ncbi:MAG: hypothetical protein RIC36_05055 [Rhodospirillales bacterium]